MDCGTYVPWILSPYPDVCLGVDACQLCEFDMSCTLHYTTLHYTLFIEY